MVGLPQPRFDGDPGADEALQGGHCHLSRGRPLRLLLSHHLGARAQADAWPAEVRVAASRSPRPTWTDRHDRTGWIATTDLD
eukprot:7284247-Prymnesium_polylepis.1